jgi:hypothetical protein
MTLFSYVVAVFWTLLTSSSALLVCPVVIVIVC